MVFLQLFSRDARRDAAVLLVEVVPVDELVAARRALPSAYPALHTKRGPLLLKYVALRKRSLVSVGRFSGQADGEFSGERFNRFHQRHSRFDRATHTRR